MQSLYGQHQKKSGTRKGNYMGKREKQFVTILICIILIIVGSLYQTFEKGEGTITLSTEEGITIENNLEEGR